MTLREEVLERSSAVCERLREGKVKADPYHKPIAGTTVAIVNTHKDIIKVWAGLADIDVKPDPKHKQAVMNIHEGGRSITKSYLVPVYGNTFSREAESDSQILKRAEHMFPVRVPNGTFEGKVVEHGLKDRYGSRAVRVAATMTAAESRLSLLVGMDEVAQFISALPADIVESVDEAHDLLRGRVSPEAKRQGEWFFTPVTQAEARAINGYLHTTSHNVNGAQLEPGSNHHASCIISVNRQRYVIGIVTDTRGTRHEPLLLPEWHRVSRNQERTVPAAMNQRTQTYWD